MSVQEFVNANLRVWRYRFPELAEKTGVPVKTIRKVSSEQIKNPGIKTIDPLFMFFVSELMKDSSGSSRS